MVDVRPPRGIVGEVFGKVVHMRNDLSGRRDLWRRSRGHPCGFTKAPARATGLPDGREIIHPRPLSEP